MIQHHPDDDLLLSRAAGSLDSGAALVVTVHLESCLHCRERMRMFDVVGGALLEQLPPSVLAPPALAQTLAAIDAFGRAHTLPRTATFTHPELPAGCLWPAALRHCNATRWRWLGPGMHWSRLGLPYDSAANVFLLRIASGKMLPMHTHSENELTQVLYGAFDDGRARFGAGDFDEANGDVRHQPTVLAQGECICLANVRGKVLFEGVVARTLGALVGL
ncbi:MAG: ChrR family anti-sigma-E factor [Burkholderiaceae bacterium]